MRALPKRRVLRSIVQDAISDREEFSDPDIAEQTAATIASYHDLLPRLADDAPPLSEADRRILASACGNARIWREGYKDAWVGTGEKRILHDAQIDIDRVTRTEEALGLDTSDPLAACGTISIFELMKRPMEMREVAWSEA